MSVVRTITDLAGTVVERSVHAVRHPRESAASAIGLARGVGGSVLGGHRRSDPPADGPADAAADAPGAAHGDEVPDPMEPTVEVPEDVLEAEAAAAAAAAAGDEESGAEPTGGIPEPPDVETPVGTTGVGEGYNPDTGDTDLQQPGTEPLMDPSLTKAVKSESDTLRKAAGSDTGEE